MKNLLLLLLLAFMISCKDDRPDEPLSQDEGKYRNGESYRISAGDQAINLNILKIMESRCPSGVECIWHGYAGVKFEIGIGTETFTDSVFTPGYPHMKLFNTREFTVNGKTTSVTLKDVTPYPCYQCKNIPPKQEAIIEIKQW